MENAVAQAITRPITDGHGAVCVVNVFVARSHLVKHESAQLQRELLNFSIVWLQKLFQRRRRRILLGHQLFDNSFAVNSGRVQKDNSIMIFPAQDQWELRSAEN